MKQIWIHLNYVLSAVVFAFYAIYIFELKDAKALPTKNYVRGVLKTQGTHVIFTNSSARFSLPLIYFLILTLFSEGVTTNTVFPYLCIYSSPTLQFLCIYPTCYYCSLAQVCVVSINHQLKAGNRCLGNEMISCVKQ